MNGRLLIFAIDLLNREQERDRERGEAIDGRPAEPLKPLRPGAFAAWAARRGRDQTDPVPARPGRTRPVRPATQRGLSDGMSTT